MVIWMKRKKMWFVLMMFVLMAMPLMLNVSEDYKPVDIADGRSFAILAAAPTNNETPVCTNLDDTTYMYSKLREYIITVNASDTDGYTNISTIDFSLLDASDNSTIWTIRYTNSTNAFSETAGQTLIELVTGSSSASRSGDFINLTIALKIEWIHGDYENTNCRSTIDDGVTATMDNYTSTNWDIETDLDCSGLTISSAEGLFGETNTISGTVVYQGSAEFPASGDVDVWCAVPTGLTAQSDLVLVSGVFSMGAVPSLASAGINTYTVTVVVESDGATGTDLCHETHTVTYTGIPHGGDLPNDNDPPDGGGIGFGLFFIQVLIVGAIGVVVLYVIVRVL